MQGIFGTQDLSVVYNKGTPAESVALKGVSFFALPEEFVVVYGPSGCGKSTLLYTLTGIERHIDSGDVWLNGKNVAAMTALDLIALHRHDVGMIFQAYNLISTLNVMNNVTLPLMASGMPEKKRAQSASELLERFLIGHLAKRYPSQLSGGQQQRVAIARALVTDPAIIVADEPTGNLDSQSTEIVLQQLLELNSRYKKTILLVTHDPSFLVYADRVLYMKDGTIVKVEVKKGLREMDRSGSPLLALEAENPFGSSPFDQKKNDEELTFENYSYISCIGDFASSIAHEENEILQNRLQNILAEIALEMLSYKDALRVLSRPIPQGGMGYSTEFAIDILTELDDLFLLRRTIAGKPSSQRLSPIVQVHIMRWLLGSRFGTMTTAQSILFQHVVVEYLLQHLSIDKFIAKLEESLEHGGVGLLGYNTTHLAKKMKQIMDLIPIESHWSP